MKAALAGRPNVPFQAPDGITWVEIDKETGKLAAPFCQTIINSPFIAGTEPADSCELHRF